MHIHLIDLTLNNIYLIYLMNFRRRKEYVKVSKDTVKDTSLQPFSHIGGTTIDAEDLVA